MASLRENLFVTENELSRIIVDSAFTIHTTLGPGLFESVYEATMAFELSSRGVSRCIATRHSRDYKDVKLDLGFRADIVVNGKVIVEIKSIEGLGPVHSKQLLTYLRLTEIRLGLLINFNANLIKDGIRRVVNNLDENRT